MWFFHKKCVRARGWCGVCGCAGGMVRGAYNIYILRGGTGPAIGDAMNRPRRMAPVLDAMNRVSTVYNMCAGMGGDERSGQEKPRSNHAAGLNPLVAEYQKIINDGVLLYFVGRFDYTSREVFERFAKLSVKSSYSRRTDPTTSAMPVISSSGMSKGGYSLLSETAVRQFLCCEGMRRLTRMPCSRVAIT